VRQRRRREKIKNEATLMEAKNKKKNRSVKPTQHRHGSGIKLSKSERVKCQCIIGDLRVKRGMKGVVFGSADGVGKMRKETVKKGEIS